MATRSPQSNGGSSPRYREKADDDEYDGENGSRNNDHYKSRLRRENGSRSCSRSRSGSPGADYIQTSKQKVPIKLAPGKGRLPSRSPSPRNERKRRSFSRDDDNDKHRDRNGKRRDRRSRSRSVDSHSPPRYPRRSRSRSPGYRDSRSPVSSRGRRLDNPTPSRCVAVFGLSMYTRERELRDIFAKYGQLEDVQVVYDKQTGRSRGFAFIYFRNVDSAVLARDKLAGTEVDGRQIRVDFSTTERAHTPTPGIYMGRVNPNEREKEREKSRRGDSHGHRGDRQSPPRRRYGRSRSRSPYSRSRSRSFSPPHRRRDY